MATEREPHQRSTRAQTLLRAGLLVVSVILINVLANSRLGSLRPYAALDLTEDQRYTLTPGTRAVLEDLDEVVFVRVLLEGNFPAGFKRLQATTREMLEDFRAVSPYIEFEFADPGEGSTEEINAYRKQLSEDGITPVNLRVAESEAASVQLIYPYAVFYYGGRRIPVNILENNVPGVPPEVVLNNAVALLEYKFVNAIQKLQRAQKPLIAFTSGQGELVPVQTADLEKTLQPYYETGRLALDSVVSISPDDIRALIVAKPTRPFSEKNKFKLDQYVMNGGKILWLIDHIGVDLDSLQGRRNFFPVPRALELEDLLFRYGIRFNNDLVQDLRCTRIPLAVGTLGNAPQLELFRYPYHLIALPQSDHPIVKSLEGVNLFYPSSLDLQVRTKYDVQRTVLLQSSDRARYQRLPVEMDFDFLRYELDDSKFTQDSMVMGVLLEGRFNSLYENRLSADNEALLQQLERPFRTESEPNRMIVVADGDVAANPVNPDGSVLPLGFNRFEKYQFSNRDFIVNALEYLIDEQGVIAARGKEVKLRLLDVDRAESEARYWQAINIGVPLLLLLVCGLAYSWWRRRSYTT